MDTYEQTEYQWNTQEPNAYFEMPDIPKPPEPKKRRSGHIWRAILACVLVIALVAVGCCTTAYLVNRHWEHKTNLLYATSNNNINALRQEIEALKDSAAKLTPSVILPEGWDAEEGMLSPRQVYALNVNSVVAIANQGSSTNIYGQITETASSGTGFIISEDGYIVSNHHVVEGAKKLEVITANGKVYEAKLVGYDELNDVSVLKIDADDLPHVTFGSSNTTMVGEQVAAIGNPLGELTSTMTVGYISARDRMISTDGSYINMLQTDAAINSGNSGGPLFNMQGQVIGITTAKYSGLSNSGASIEGIGFAIPIDDVLDIIQDLQEFGYVETAYLGVMVQDVPLSDVNSKDLPRGALVVDVTKGTCADKAGLQTDDIITDIGGQTVDSLSGLSRVLRSLQPGETTVITVYRDGSDVTMEIMLDKKPVEKENEGWTGFLDP